MDTSLGRIKRDILKLSEFTATPGLGCTRFSYSEEDRKAKDYLIEEFKRLGLKISVDAVGNIRARLEGEDPEAPVIMSGSHIDTVLNGGNFDGAVGVVGALEAVRVIVENNIKVKNSIEVVIFVEEEGSNFNATIVGSKALIGRIGIEDLKKLKTEAGISLYEMAKKSGLNPDDILKDAIKPGEVKAMIEMHIEQSMVLDSKKIPVGVINAAAGIKWINVEFRGVSNHAGATPMYMRHDPMVGAAKLITALEKIVKERAFHTTVGTVGRIICFPNIPNAIPEKVSCMLDIRDIKPEGIEITLKEVNEIIEQVSKEHGLEVDVQVKGEITPVKFSKKVNKIIEDTAVEKNIDFLKINSGAVHDACIFAEVAETGMIFVPSVNGRSHVPDEFTNFEDIKLGCDVLLGAILKLAN